MNELGEHALVQLLSGWAALTALVQNRILWDDSELDVTRPCVRLRTLSTRMPVNQFNGRGGSRLSLVEVACDDDDSTGCSRVIDAAIAALTPYESAPFSVPVVTMNGSEARFGSIVLQDVMQSRSLRERSYRKTALFAVWLYE